jgi:hypothetical protein
VEPVDLVRRRRRSRRYPQIGTVNASLAAATGKLACRIERSVA